MSTTKSKPSAGRARGPVIFASMFPAGVHKSVIRELGRRGFTVEVFSDAVKVMECFEAGKTRPCALVTDSYLFSSRELSHERPTHRLMGFVLYKLVRKKLLQIPVIVFNTPSNFLEMLDQNAPADQHLETLFLEESGPQDISDCLVQMLSKS